MDPLTLTAAAAATTAAAAYLDARLDLRSDLRLVSGVVAARLALQRDQRRDQNSIWYYFERSVHKRGKQECLRCEGTTLSWNQVYQASNRLARYLLSLNLQRGDTIALLMPNKPFYPIVFLACLAVDIVPAFINTNLTDKALSHCLSIANPKVIIFDTALSQPLSAVSQSLSASLAGVRFVRYTDQYSYMELEEKRGKLAEVPIEGELKIDEKVLAGFSGDKVPNERRSGVRWDSPACLIYTSGTTGLPKAAPSLHGRCATAWRVWVHINGFNRKSRIYSCMPLYHSTGLILSVGMSWLSSSTVIIGRKFSATRFWKEVKEGEADSLVYVGEVLRYLLAAPPTPQDKDHKVKLAYGNGCRPDVWDRFRERFGVRTISEFFASTEGNGSLFNHSSNSLASGAVGREGALVASFQKDRQILIKVDPITEEPERDEKGLCVKCKDGEKGELVILVIGGSGYQAFAGYHNNEKASEKKILRDVVKKGDTFYRSNDLLYRTPAGLWYFADRLGDTFRWKSENVSTTEVQEKVGEVVGEVVVYGVEVPGYDGRAGCAAVPRSTRPVDFAKLVQHVKKTLPRYAWPVFVRMVDKIEQTGTSKAVKTTLKNQGVDPFLTGSDEVYWLHPKKGEYVRFEREDWEGLANGKGGYKL
ncbi:hypothetical protein JCM11641_003860 [Rhodosporidiobolus odoratus]